jgi:hypothetical protein
VTSGAPRELGVEAANKAVHLALFNILAMARQRSGSFDKVTQIAGVGVSLRRRSSISND